MSERILLFVFAAINLLTVDASATGSKIGNGGIGVECPSTSSRIRFLDFVEAEIAGYRCDLNSEAFLEDELARISSSLILAGAPETSVSKVFWRARNLLTSMILVDGLDLSQDAGFIALPKGCRTVQVAVLRFDSPTPLSVLRQFWRYQTSREKALVLFHEAFHNEFAQSESFRETSNIRQLIGLLSQRESDLIYSSFEIQRLFNALVDQR